MSNEKQSSSPFASKKMPTDGDGKVCTQMWTKAVRTSAPRGAQRIGLEIEMFAYDAKTFAPLGIPEAKLTSQDLILRLEKLIPNSILKVDAKTDSIVGLELEGGANFSLEPGGQVEFSSRPHETLDNVAKEVGDAFELLEEAAKHEVVFLDHGTNPLAPADIPLMVPKHRYKILDRYFRSQPGGRGVHMMRNTATVQPNLDVYGEDNWNEATKLGFVLTPFARHLFSNSKFFQQQPSKYSSERQAIWESTDASRTGIPEKVPFAKDIACEYAEWARHANVFLVGDLPIEEQPKYGELKFVDWLNNGYKGTSPTLQDWETHLGTLFPDLRLRGFLEVRSVDAQSFEHLFASCAFWSALLQNGEARHRALEFINGLALGLEHAGASGHETPLQTLLHLPADAAIFKDVRTHQKLLQIAAESFGSSDNQSATRALHSFSKFVETRGSHTLPNSALQFVKETATLSPSKEFLKHVKSARHVAGLR